MNAARMKAIPIVLVLLCSAAPRAFAQAPPKLGHIDRQQLLMLLPQRKEAEEKVRGQAEAIKQRIEAMHAEYETMLAKMGEEFPSMTEERKRTAQNEARQAAQRIQEAEQRAEADLEELQEELLAPLLEQVGSAIHEVAATHGFTYIFDTSTGLVAFWDNGEDIMPLVKAKLGIQ